MQDVNKRENWVGSIRELLVLSLQLLCKSATVLKENVY